MPTVRLGEVVGKRGVQTMGRSIDRDLCRNIGDRVSVTAEELILAGAVIQHFEEALDAESRFFGDFAVRHVLVVVAA